MAAFGNIDDLKSQEPTPLPALSWAGYMQHLASGVDQVKRVVKGGGLQDPTIAEHLRASRLHQATHSHRND